MKRLLRFFRETSALTGFRSLPANKRSIVFYSEDTASWVHLGPVANALIDDLDRHVCCVTSDPNA